MPHSRSFLANQKARNAIVGAQNLLKTDSLNLLTREHFSPLKFLNMCYPGYTSILTELCQLILILLC